MRVSEVLQPNPGGIVAEDPGGDEGTVDGASGEQGLVAEAGAEGGAYLGKSEHDVADECIGVDPAEAAGLEKAGGGGFAAADAAGEAEDHEKHAPERE